MNKFMYEKDKYFLLEDFCSYIIDHGYDKATTDAIDDFIADLKAEISKPYVMAQLDTCEIENYLQKVFIDLEITSNEFTY